MGSRRVGILRVVLVVVVLLAAALVILGTATVRRGFPQVGGSLRVPGLEHPVEVYRDAMGVPQIYAQTAHDLFLAQGFVHAQDRFWQMDFWRHIGSGRLAEMFGAGQVEKDRFLRTLGWARVAEQELAASDAATRSALEAYAQGVNAYLTQRQGAALSLEYAVLGLLHPDYKPEPWTPVNTLTWAKVMAWDLGGNMDTEIERSLLLRTLTAAQVGELYPAYPSDHPTILGASTSAAAALQDGVIPAALPSLAALDRRLAALGLRPGAEARSLGSNNWVVGASHTTTGAPLLANDMHLGIQMPSIWYEVGLHCAPVTPDCPYDVTGFSFAGAPGVIVGHNAHIAWGVTNAGPDVQDLYIEKINPANPNQYEVDGRWVDMTLVQESLKVAGGQAVPITVRYTRHGPVLSDVDKDLAGIAEATRADGAGTTAGTQPPAYAISLRWTALDPGRVFAAVQELDRASNWDEFRRALRDWSGPSQNFVYADVEGNIGYQMPGDIPIRAGGDGQVPVPGWTDAYEWTGLIPFDALPLAFNPQQGFIVTANNAVVGPGYPFLLSLDWDLGYRAARIEQMIQAKPRLSAADFQSIQGDDENPMGAVLVPHLTALRLDDSALRKPLELLAGWDYQNRMDSAPAALFNAFWRHLILRTFSDDLPEGHLPGDDRAFAIVARLVDQPDSPWWDDRRTPAVERRDDIFRLAMADAVAELERLLGKDPASWRWGALHTATFRNASLGESGVAPIEALFNRGPYEAAGGSSIVNATSWDYAAGYAVTSLPSERMIVDLGDFGASLMVHTTGQSGHAFDAHYADMIDLWRTIQYRPMPWDAAAIASSAKETLKLIP